MPDTVLRACNIIVRWGDTEELRKRLRELKTRSKRWCLHCLFNTAEISHIWAGVLNTLVFSKGRWMACTKSDVKGRLSIFSSWRLGNTGQVFPVLTPIISWHVLRDDLINACPQLDHKFHHCRNSVCFRPPLFSQSLARCPVLIKCWRIHEASALES